MDSEISTLLTREDSCACWGLRHWFYGIKEYVFDRCLFCGRCGFVEMDEDRAFIRQEEQVSSDCCWVCFFPISYNNPIAGTLCLPFTALAHLCCLPCACCASRKGDGYGEERATFADCKAAWMEENNLTEEDCEYMDLEKGLDNAQHLKNCLHCRHPAHATDPRNSMFNDPKYKTGTWENTMYHMNLAVQINLYQQTYYHNHLSPYRF